MHSEQTKQYILIHALKGHGKSTLARMINKSLNLRGLQVQEQILADPIRDMVSKTFPETKWEDFENEVTKNLPHPGLFGQTPRKVMQLFGTNFAQECFGKEIWCKILESNTTDCDYSIIPDVRFSHEVDYFKDKMKIMIFLYREGVVQDEFNNHSSESGLMHLYDADNPRHIRIDLPKESTLEATEEYVREVLFDLILEVK